MNLGTAGTSRTAALATVSAQDVDFSFRFTTNKTPTGSNQFIYGVARRVSATTSYRIVLRIATNGQVFAGASSVLNNAETAIGSSVLVPGLTHTPGSFIRVRAQLTGTNPTTIRIRVWADGSTEPSTWLYTATNSVAQLQVPGGVGLQAYLASATTNAPVLVTFDDFLVTSIGSAPANTPPVVDSVTIGPASPTTNQTLTATVTSHDADGNPLTTAYQWTRNGTDIPGATGSTLNLATAGNGDKGDLIRVRVTVNDGTATSPAVISSPVTVVNTAPLATVGLSPASPSTTATLTATATKSDADADAVGLTFVWKVNGTTVRTFSSPTALTDTLNLATAGNGDPGDIVSVEVTPNDGTINGTLVSAQVTVASANTPPVVDSVTIGPASPTTNQTLTATVTSHDADGNPLTTAYQWTRNGTDIPGATGSTLNLATAGNGDKGDLIRVRVTVNDGTATSPAVISSPVTVVNTAPLATVGLSPASPSTTATLTATATKSDADADAVGLTFVWKVNGTTVRTFSSPTALTDTLNLATAGNGDPGDIVSVEVTPNDGTINGTLVSAQVTVARLLGHLCQ